MSDHDLLPLVLDFLLVVLMILAARHWGPSWPRAYRQLVRELGRCHPLYSAETTRGREAEFIRDRLPRKFPVAPLVVAAAIFCVVAWWLAR
jgi:hypothetical protein